MGDELNIKSSTSVELSKYGVVLGSSSIPVTYIIGKICANKFILKKKIYGCKKIFYRYSIDFLYLDSGLFLLKLGSKIAVMVKGFVNAENFSVNIEKRLIG